MKQPETAKHRLVTYVTKAELYNLRRIALNLGMRSASQLGAYWIRRRLTKHTDMHTALAKP